MTAREVVESFAVLCKREVIHSLDLWEMACSLAEKQRVRSGTMHVSLALAGRTQKKRPFEVRSPRRFSSLEHGTFLQLECKNARRAQIGEVFLLCPVNEYNCSRLVIYVIADTHVLTEGKLFRFIQRFGRSSVSQAQSLSFRLRSCENIHSPRHMCPTIIEHCVRSRFLGRNMLSI